ncbi:MAG: DUF4368 domain-containing protein [Clostridiales bacterium]|nr:DUF4368 domain-containing protein [Clostridiales bacterium]
MQPMPQSCGHADYTEVDELTPYRLNRIIEKIQVGHAEIVNGRRRQEIGIVWRYLGIV